MWGCIQRSENTRAPDSNSPLQFNACLVSSDHWPAPSHAHSGFHRGRAEVGKAGVGGRRAATLLFQLAALLLGEVLEAARRSGEGGQVRMGRENLTRPESTNQSAAALNSFKKCARREAATISRRSEQSQTSQTEVLSIPMPDGSTRFAEPMQRCSTYGVAF